MKGQLLEKGLSDATFNPGDGQQITGEELGTMPTIGIDGRIYRGSERRKP